ncbi:MAG: DegV family protein [Clostridium sp.]|nr:DegV family protein [Clostridium sp.]MCM1170580.1 DegV family protein [Clostridium sp.]MCM1207287.1 DegV family protein [Ruminococcus sp.]
MKRDYVIVADSTNDLPKSFAKENEIRILPLLYEIDGESYGKDKELPLKEFYDRMRNGSPTKTAAANLEDINGVFEEIAKEGKDILFTCLSSGISSTVGNAMISKNDIEEKYPECHIRVVDSLCASGGQGMFLYLAVNNKKAGLSLDENADKLEKDKMNIVHKFTVEDLIYLYRGGRVSKTAATLGTMINLKPLLHVDNEGKLVLEAKARGRKKSLQQMIKNFDTAMGSFRDKQELIIVCHADSIDDANFCVDMIKEMYNPKDIVIGEISPTIGAHSGPGTIAIFFMGDIR